MTVRKIVEVEWFDAQSSMEALTMKEIEEELMPIYSKSVGYLLIDKEEYIILGFLDFGDGLIKHHQVIPKPIIKKMKVIREGQK
jgi:hypothetical protein